jgi:uncharacterized protein (DUF362 family)
MKSKVSLSRSSDHYSGVELSLKILKQNIADAISGLSQLVIKINLVITRIPRYDNGVELATTPIEAVRSFVDFILPFYRGRILIAEEAAWGNTKDGFDFYGFTRLASKNSQIELLDLREDDTLVKKVSYPGGELELPLSKSLVEAPFLVSIARPKTHCSVVMTAGMKNVLVGAIQGHSNRIKIHRDKYKHYMMASLADYVYPDFVIIDGTIGMEGGGPIRGSEIRADWVLSSFDALAADSFAAYLMGIDVEDVGYINLVSGKGLGRLYPANEIEILGERPEDLVKPFLSLTEVSRK